MNVFILIHITAEMRNAAKILEFEHAAYLRDKITKLKQEQDKNHPGRARVPK